MFFSSCGNHLLALLKHAILLRHAGDQVHEARRVAPLVVVPRHELHEGRRQHDAHASVEDRRVRLADEIRRHHLILRVPDDSLRVRLRRQLHLGLDLVVRSRGLQLARQIHHRDVHRRDPERHTRQLALHHRVALGHGLGGARGGRDDVGGGSAARAPVLALHGTIHRELRRSRRVNRRHQALLDAELVVDHLHNRSKPVRSAGGVRHHVHRGRVDSSVLTPTTMVGVSASLAGAEMTTFLAPAGRCASHFSVVRKAPVDSQTYSTPASFHGISSGERTPERVTGMPLTMSEAPSSAISHVPLKRPWTVSYSMRYLRYSGARAALMCLTTNASRSMAMRTTWRPMRPKPLTPSLIGALALVDMTMGDARPREADDRASIVLRERVRGC